MIQIFDFLLNLDKYLDQILSQYGNWTYLILFLVIFAETGFVFTPFLPGDSLLFIVGTFAARGYVDLYLIVLVLSLAAIIGDTVNYWIGYHLGPRVFKHDQARFLKKEYLDKTKDFYAKYGPMTIVLGRFLPIIRTFAPFVAGVGRMDYWRFLLFNIGGGILWVILFVLAGFFFGNLPWIQNNFSLAITIIILVSLVPTVLEILRRKIKKAA